MTVDDDIAFVRGYLRKPSGGLRFSPRLERRYLVQRGRKGANLFYLIALIAMISMNLSGVSLRLGGVIPGERALRMYLDAQGVVVLPVLIATAYMRRFPRALIHYDALLTLQCLCAVLGFVLLNTELPFPISLYQSFMLPVVPIAFNLFVGMRFVFAAPLTVFYLAPLLADIYLRPEFPHEAKLYLTLSYVFSTLGSLVANFRVERAERFNFLRLWRDNLKSVEIERANRSLDALARTDGLTGLVNRREFDARFTADAKLTRAQGTPLTLIVLDIDHFKLYNDRLGHPQGDKCIRAVAQALGEAVGPAPNFAGRIGGEEFAAVLPGAPVEKAAAIAQKIRGAVEAMQLPHPALGERRVVSVSLGVASLNPARPETPEALMARADSALYRAKRAGRDRAEVDLKVVGA